MNNTMSLLSRRELIESVKQKYSEASWLSKGKILDGFVAATNYERKYAIQLLNTLPPIIDVPKKRASRQYDSQMREALIFIWNTANQICSKRLVPFLPELIKSMETNGHLRLPSDVKNSLLKMSASTVDRILKPERETMKLGISTTSRGSLLKHQIKIRTFADWNDVIPGFIEADLVAHCGGNTSGTFLNTLTLIDISTSWLEIMPLLKKSANNVIECLRVANDLFPFPVQGIDTDCGSEFINYDLLDYCESKQITFTRARTHKKNDQAHVEEKNGSVVRRLVGYDRFEGYKAWEALARFYQVLRKYINYFQPSLKLIHKDRQGAKVSKKYDQAKTPYQRVMLSEHISLDRKKELTNEYETLDPVTLFAQIKSLQNDLWKFAWNKNGGESVSNDLDNNTEQSQSSKEKGSDIIRYYHIKPKIDYRKMPRTWRTRKDPFKNSWDEIRLRLEIMPELTAKQVIEWLINKYGNEYSLGQTRTLQRRIAEWHHQQENHEEKLRNLMLVDDKLI
jgi:Integrase core domain